MSDFRLCVTYEEAGASPLVVARVEDYALLRQAVEAALRSAEDRAARLAHTDLAEASLGECERLRRIAEVIAAPATDVAECGAVAVH